MSVLDDDERVRRRRTPEETLARIQERRVRHERRPLPLRVLVAAVGFLVVLIGLALLIPVGEVGAPVLIGGLGLLALEFHWAGRALAWVLVQLERVQAWYGRQHVVVKVVVVGGGLALVVVLALWLAGVI